MAEEYRYEQQRVLPPGGKLGVHARVQRVKVRVHRCRGALCLECSDTWQPKPVVRRMTPAELENHERVGSPVVADWSVD